MNNTPSPLNLNGTWRHYGIADGLPGLQLEHLAEDADGYLWIATWNGGVARFDGDEFQTFTTRDGLPANGVLAIYRDRQDRLWFGTLGGVCWYDGRTFHRFAKGDGVADKAITCIFADRDGRLWFGGSEALGYFDGESFHDLIPEYQKQHGEALIGAMPAHCWGLAQDQAGHIWFGGAHHSGTSALVRFDGERFHQYGEQEGLSTSHNAIVNDAEGNLWIGSNDSVWRYDGQEFQQELDDPAETVRKIRCDPQGRIWICTIGDGVYCRDGANLHQFNQQQGLAFDAVNDALQDREGHIWFATWGGGLTCYNPHSLVLRQEDGLFHNNVSPIVEDASGHIWMGHSLFLASEVISRYDGEKIDVFDKDIYSMALFCDSRGQLFSGGRSLMQYDGESFHQPDKVEGIKHLGVSAIAEDAQGRLILGHWGSVPRGTSATKSDLQVSRFDGRHFQLLFSLELERQYQHISALVPARDGGIWFAIADINDVSERGFGRWREDGSVTYYTRDDGLIANNVKDLVEDRQGRLWIATLSGLNCFDGDQFQTFTVEDGLPSNNVHCAFEDRQGRLFFGTDAGAVRCDDGLFQPISSPEIFAVHDIIQDRQDRYWFATVNGAVRYQPSPVAPKVRIRQILADQIYEPGNEIRFSTSTQQVIFEYKGMSFRTHSRDMLYSHRLAGRETDWSAPTRAMRTFYRDLAPGDYTFQVKALDRDLNESEPAALKFTITRSSHEAKIDELERRVQERTVELEEKNRALEEASLKVQEANRLKTEFLARMSHDLRTPMNAIIGYARILLRKLDGQIDPRQFTNLENIQTSAHHLLDLINDILDLSKVEAGRVEVHPQDVELPRIVGECLSAISPLIKDGVKLHQDLGDIGQLYTDPDRLKRALMNLLSNAVKFTEQGTISVCAYRKEDHIEIAVSDTGAGIPADDLPHIFDEFRQVARKGSNALEGTGLGLAIVRLSIELLGGQVAVESTAGQGTTFTLTIPLATSPTAHQGASL